MTKQLTRYTLTVLITVLIFVLCVVALDIPYLAQACDVGCGGIVGVFLMQ